MEALGKIVVFLVTFALLIALALTLAVPINLLQGKILSDLWGWFIQPNFDIALSYPAACGMMIIFSLFTLIPHQRGYEQSKMEFAFERLLRPVVGPLVLWALGAIMKFWIL